MGIFAELMEMNNFISHRRFLNIFKRYYTSKSSSHFPRQVYSAIQPTGEVHLGNYFGAIKKWVELQKEEENLIFSIADLHAMSVPQDPNTLRADICYMTATLLACGIDVNKSILYQQSDVHQHAELCWIFGTLCTMARLSRLPQFKEKSESMTNVPVALFSYPLLQAADIALYKTTHVPIGRDQETHLQIANELIHSFNRRYGPIFPKVTPVIDEHASSIKSLVEPHKKMSKSGKPKSTINLLDPPDVIVMKCVKALTDFNSRVSYDPENRPGISNLLLIHSLLTNKSIDMICKESENLNTGQYKLILADAIVEALKPIREDILRYMGSKDYLENILRSGAERALEKSTVTMREVKDRTGIKSDPTTTTGDTLFSVKHKVK